MVTVFRPRPKRSCIVEGKRVRISEYKHLMRSKRGLWYGQGNGPVGTSDPVSLTAQQTEALKDYLKNTPHGDVGLTQFLGSVENHNQAMDANGGEAC